MKKFLIVILLLLVAVCSFGCIRSTGHYNTKMSVSEQTDSSFKMSYEVFDGQKTYSFTVAGNATLSVKFVTESGSLSCVITDKSGKEYYKNENVQTEELTIPLDKEGEYSVELKAQNHKGSFSFSW